MKASWISKLTFENPPKLYCTNLSQNSGDLFETLSETNKSICLICSWIWMSAAAVNIRILAYPGLWPVWPILFGATHLRKSPVEGRRTMAHGCCVARTKGYGRRKGRSSRRGFCPSLSSSVFESASAFASALVSASASASASSGALQWGQVCGKVKQKTFTLQWWKQRMPGSEVIVVVLVVANMAPLRVGLPKQRKNIIYLF